MKVRDYINQIIPALKPHDMLENALIWMEENKIAELPVVDEEDEIIGFITESFLLQKADLSLSVSESALPDYKPNTLLDERHIFEAFTYIANNRLTIVPVVDSNNKFQGVISIHDLIQVFGEISSFKEIGGIIILGMKSIDYNLSDIARIVETNGAKVLSTFILSEDESQNDLKVVVKINHQRLNAIIASFERYEYQIIEKFSSDEEDDPYYDNLGNLFKFLDQ